MINWLWLIPAVVTGLALGSFPSIRGNQDAYDEGREDAFNDVEYLKAINIDLAKQVEINRVIGGIK